MGLSAAINPVLPNSPPVIQHVTERSFARPAAANFYCKGSANGRHCRPKAALAASQWPRSSSRFRKDWPRGLRRRGAIGTRMSAVDTQRSLALLKKALDLFEGLRGTSIFLVGITSTFKTEVGKALAEALSYYYFDSDDIVGEASGDTGTARAFLENDEKGFRETETEVLKQLSAMGHLVVSCGDGAVRSSTNLACLRHGISVWIDVPLDLLADEVINGKCEYPLAQAVPSTSSIDEVLDGLAGHYRENKDGYATADAKISLPKVAAQLGYDDLRSVTPDDVALEVLIQIEKLIRVKKMMDEAGRPF